MSVRRSVSRGGPYDRVAAPEWIDPADTAYSKQRGGRWNPVGELGALYLNATIQVAAANARAQHARRAIKLLTCCRKLGREAHADGLAGVAARSNAEVTETASIGGELALFEEVVLAAPQARRRFDEWYPAPIPG